jgi:hypothetical protein
MTDMAPLSPKFQVRFWESQGAVLVNVTVRGAGPEVLLAEKSAWQCVGVAVTDAVAVVPVTVVTPVSVVVFVAPTVVLLDVVEATVVTVLSCIFGVVVIEASPVDAPDVVATETVVSCVFCDMVPVIGTEGTADDWVALTVDWTTPVTDDAFVAETLTVGVGEVAVRLVPPEDVTVHPAKKRVKQTTKIAARRNADGPVFI